MQPRVQEFDVDPSVTRAAGPDGRAQDDFARAVVACAPLLLGCARQMVGSQEADDLVQNTVERALRHQGSFQPNSNLLAWLRRIMSNLMVDSWRNQNRHQTCPLGVDDHAAPNADPPPIWAEFSGADLRACVALLKPSFRTVFELFCQGLPYQEIARRLQVPIGTVGTRLLRGRARLRALLMERLAQRQAIGGPSQVDPTGGAPVTALAHRWARATSSSRPSTALPSLRQGPGRAVSGAA